MICTNIILGFGGVASNLNSYRNSHPNGGSESGNYIGPIFFIVVTGLIVLIVLLSTRGNKSWEKGYIPKRFKATPQNILEIYISAAAALSVHDREGLKSQKKQLNSYLLKHFPDEYYDFSDSYDYSLKHRVKTDSLAAWCNKELITRDKINLLNFLAEIAVKDGYVTDAEKHHLKDLREKLRLSVDQMDESFRKYFFD